MRAAKSSQAGPAGQLLTRTEFAAMKGWDPAYITRLVKKKRLVLTGDGKKIDVDASEVLLKKHERVDRQGVREHHARSRRPKVTPQDTGASAPPPGDGAGAIEAPKPDELSAYNRARAEREAAMAAMAVMDQRQREGELVEVAQVRDMAARIAGIIAGGFERVGPRIGPVWSTEQDPAKRERLLEAELRQIQSEFADAIAQLGAGGA